MFMNSVSPMHVYESRVKRMKQNIKNHFNLKSKTVEVS